MQKIQLGKSKVKITKLGMGTWAIGGGPASVSYTHLDVYKRQM